MKCNLTELSLQISVTFCYFKNILETIASYVVSFIGATTTACSYFSKTISVIREIRIGEQICSTTNWEFRQVKMLWRETAGRSRDYPIRRREIQLTKTD